MDKVLLGKVHGLFGVRGWLKVYSYARPAENLLDYERWYIQSEQDCPDQWRSFRVLAARKQGKTLVAQLAENDQPIEDRDVAAELLNARIAVDRADMPDLPAGEFYWHDLIGLEVHNREAQVLGTVRGMLETGATDVLEVKGQTTHLIPFVQDVYIDEVNLDAGRIVVDWGADFSQ